VIGVGSNVLVLGFGTVGVLVYARNMEEARVCAGLVAALYAREMVRDGRDRAS